MGAIYIAGRDKKQRPVILINLDKINFKNV